MTSAVISESLDVQDTRSVRDLLRSAFDGDFTEYDWLHALGGHHVTVLNDGDIVAHASVVPRRIWIGERAHRVGYVEAVATRPSVQGHGHGTKAMREIEQIVQHHYGTGMLSTSAHQFYERLGWTRWLGPTWVRQPDGEVVRTAGDDGGVMVIAPDSNRPIDLRAAVTCEYRIGDSW